MKKVKNIVLGAGITGLSYANFSNEECLVIEKESTPGGFCRTFYQDGYVWDYAGHFFHFATEDVKKFFEQRLSSDEKVICNKNTKIYYGGKFIDYPFQMNIHQLSKDEFIDCLYDLAVSVSKDNYQGFLEMLYGKFGKSITEKFLRPYNEKLYACDLNELDENAMGRFFPYADLLDILRNMKSSSDKSYNSTFEYPKKGAVTFINVLVNNLKSMNVSIKYNSQIDKLDIYNHIVTIDKENIEYERLVNTVPLNMFSKYLPDNISQHINSVLHANKVLVFNLGFDKKSDIEKVHWLYFPDKDINFYRVGFYDVILDTDKLSMYVEIGYESDFDITSSEIQKQLSLTLDNLARCGIISDHLLLSYNYVIMDPAYVHITEESNKCVKDLKYELDKYDIYSIGRYGSWTYCSIEDCIIEAKNLVSKLQNLRR